VVVRNTKFHGNPSSVSSGDTCRQTDIHDEANRHYSRLNTNAFNEHSSNFRHT